MNSKDLFEEAKLYIPGGVNSPTRACGAVGAQPLFIEKASGGHIFDCEKNSYIDLVNSWGPMILGHADKTVLSAACEALYDGFSFGAPTEKEVRLAKIINEAIPSMETLRLVSSGTEAVMSALRVARGYTGRDKIVKFSGCYHGHCDSMLVKAGSGLFTQGIPDSAGVPKGVAQDTLTVTYNDENEVSEVFRHCGNQIAAVILEPVAGNMGIVPPKPGFLRFLRDITLKFGALLIFDEVITGFRVCYGGVQNLTGVTPDLTTLGKIVGGGMPLGAYGGRRDIMDSVAPVGSVYQAGTLSGNPVATAAGIATLNILKNRRDELYDNLRKRGIMLEKCFIDAGKSAGIPVTVNRYESLLTCFFAENPVENYSDAKKADTAKFGRFYREMRRLGVYLPSSQFEALFLSDSHDEDDMKKLTHAVTEAFLLMNETEKNI